ncbi:MAG: cation:dicarboxylase symporter family transporter [Methanocorpusculum sp.]|nr:cation:dicarboxylase symporter family transporter [Methanocorpusculum sp.]MDE2525333.1 cation:dicarboxylase symporter family transporter [Methanocorpusculum sp.]
MNRHLPLSLLLLSGLIAAGILLFHPGLREDPFLKHTLLAIVCGLSLLVLILLLNKHSPASPRHTIPADPVELRRTILQTLNIGKIARIPEENLDIAVKAVLQTWNTLIGEEHPLTCQISRHLRQPQITFAISGRKTNPLITVESEETSGKTLFKNASLTASYQYHNGENRLTLRQARKKHASYVPLLCAAIAGISVGLICRYGLPIETALELRSVILTPLFDTFLEILIAIALPMIFLSLVASLAGFGNIETFRAIGTTVLTRYLRRIFLALGIALVVCLPFIPLSLGSGIQGGGEFQSIFDLLLSIIPSSLFTPFTERHPLQIIFLAVLFGFVILLIHKSIPAVITLLEQTDYLIQQVMEKIILFLPVFIFLSMFRLMLTDQDFGQLGILFAVILVCHLIHLLMMGAEVSIARKLSPLTLIRKLLPSFLISVTTASSAATFPTNMSVCRDQCGISKKLAEFGVPLGTAFSRAGIATEYFCVSLFMAAHFGVPISLSWLIIAVIVVFLVSVAGVPVPCGNLINYPIVFAQLGISLDAMAFAIVIAVVLDYMNTAVNMVAVPIDMIQSAAKLDMLDEEKLKSDT